MVTLLLVWVDFGLNWIKKKGTTTESLSRDERLRVIYSDYVYVITFIDSLKVKFQIRTLVLSCLPNSHCIFRSRSQNKFIHLYISPVDFRSKNLETIEKFRIPSQSIVTKTNMFILGEQPFC